MKNFFLLITSILLTLSSCKEEELHVQIKSLKEFPEQWDLERFNDEDDKYILVKNQMVYELKNTIVVERCDGKFDASWYSKSQYAHKGIGFTEREQEIISNTVVSMMQNKRFLKTFSEKTYLQKAEDRLKNNIISPIILPKAQPLHALN